MTLDNLVNIQGKSIETFPKLKRVTIQHSDEITKQRIMYGDLREKQFWTGDSAIYGLNGNGAYLQISRTPQNILFKHIKKVTSHLIEIKDHKTQNGNKKVVKKRPEISKKSLKDQNSGKFRTKMRGQASEW